MEQHLVLTVARAGHPGYAEEAPLREEELPLLAVMERPREEQRGEPQREPDAGAARR